MLSIDISLLHDRRSINPIIDPIIVLKVVLGHEFHSDGITKNETFLKYRPSKNRL